MTFNRPQPERKTMNCKITGQCRKDKNNGLCTLWNKPSEQCLADALSRAIEQCLADALSRAIKKDLEQQGGKPC